MPTSYVDFTTSAGASLFNIDSACFPNASGWIAGLVPACNCFRRRKAHHRHAQPTQDRRASVGPLSLLGPPAGTRAGTGCEGRPGLPPAFLFTPPAVPREKNNASHEASCRVGWPGCHFPRDGLPYSFASRVTGHHRPTLNRERWCCRRVDFRHLSNTIAPKAVMECRSRSPSRAALSVATIVPTRDIRVQPISAYEDGPLGYTSTVTEGCRV